MPVCRVSKIAGIKMPLYHVQSTKSQIRVHIRTVLSFVKSICINYDDVRCDLMFKLYLFLPMQELWRTVDRRMMDRRGRTNATLSLYIYVLFSSYMGINGVATRAQKWEVVHYAEAAQFLQLSNVKSLTESLNLVWNMSASWKTA